MRSANVIVKTVGRVTGRVRLWRIAEALITASMFCIPFALLLFIINLAVDVPLLLLALPVVAWVVTFAVLAGMGVSRIDRFAVAKIIDDQLGLRDRLTSALYFDALGTEGGLADAAVADASGVADELDTRTIAVGTWPPRSIAVAVAALLTVVVAVGPIHITDWFRSDETEAVEIGTQELVAETPTPEQTDAPETVAAIEPTTRKESLNEMTRLESERPEERDPETMDLVMSEDLEDDIEAIKASVNLSDMKDMEDAFKDDEEKGPSEERNERPPKIAPLDKELLDDIVRSKKEKMKKGEGSKDDAIGVAVRMPAKPGAKQKGKSRGRGGHGGGDVGASGDTRGAPRRVNIAGRDAVIIESRRSADLIEKTDLEKVVMNELMMRLSMEDVTMSGKPENVPPRFTPQTRTPVVEEMIPLGLRGYVRRYFEGLGAE